MTRKQYMNQLQKLYRVANTADSLNALPWMTPALAGYAGCSAFDKILNEMVASGAIHETERQKFYDTL